MTFRKITHFLPESEIVNGMRIPVPKNSKIVFSSHYLAQKVAPVVIQSLVPYWLAYVYPKITSWP